jgi:hypothetical protein
VHHVKKKRGMSSSASSFNGTLGRVTTTRAVILPSATIDGVDVQVGSVTGLPTPTAPGSVVTRQYADGLVTSGAIDGDAGEVGPRGPWGAAPTDVTIPAAMLQWPGTVTIQSGGTVANAVASYYRLSNNMVRFFYRGDLTTTSTGGTAITVIVQIFPDTANQMASLMGAKVLVNSRVAGVYMSSAASRVSGQLINVTIPIEVGLAGSLSGLLSIAVEYLAA